jgi:hypothetical protein
MPGTCRVPTVIGRAIAEARHDPLEVDIVALEVRLAFLLAGGAVAMPARDVRQHNAVAAWRNG